MNGSTAVTQVRIERWVPLVSEEARESLEKTLARRLRFSHGRALTVVQETLGLSCYRAAIEKAPETSSRRKQASMLEASWRQDERGQVDTSVVHTQDAEAVPTQAQVPGTNAQVQQERVSVRTG